METPTAPARCQEHGLVRGPDGLCVLCKKSLGPEPASRPPLTQRVLSWPPSIKLTGIASAMGALKRSLSPRTPQPEPPAERASNQPLRAQAPATSSDRAVSSQTPRVSQTPLRSSPSSPRSNPTPPRSSVSSLRAALGLAEDPCQGFELVFYALSTCSVCRAARSYMLHHQIPFRERDVERDSSAAADALRLNPRRSVPTFDLGGREVLVGFTPHELEDALSRARLMAPARTSGRPR